MKKISIIRLFAASATVLAVLSCQKEIESAVPAGSENLVSIRVGMPEDTKVAFDGETEGLLATSWETGDKLTIVGTTTEVFTLTGGAGTKQGVFTGNAVEGDSFTIICSGASASAEEFGNVSYLDQVQDGNGDTGHLRFGATLSGVSDYSAIEFSPEWASENNATLSQNAVFKFYLKLPAAVTEVTGVRLNGETRLFNTKNSGSTVSELSLGLQNADVSMSGNILTAYMMVSAKSVTPSGKWVVEVLTGAGTTYVKSFTPATAALAGGKCHTIKLNDEGWYCLSGHGTESAPWVLTTPADLQAMSPLLVSGDDLERYTRHFEMGDDIDMTGIHWTPLVTGNQTKPLSFDGKNHTISNLTVDTAVNFPSFAGVLSGTLKNVTFDKANIKNMKTSGQQTAVVCAWAGRNKDGIGATLSYVNVTASSVDGGAYQSRSGLMVGQANGLSADHCSAQGSVIMDGLNGNDMGCAGFVGYIQGDTPLANTITDCSSNATVKIGNGRANGGFVGYVYSPASFIRCSSAGSVTANGGGRQGGFIGFLRAKSSFENCSSSCNVSSTATTGAHAGFVGEVNANDCTFTGCSATGTIVSGGYGVGGFAGMASNKSTYTNCYWEGTSVSAGKRDDTANQAWGLADGGLIGLVKSPVTVVSCHAKGTVKSSVTGYFIGGLIGNIQAGGKGSSISKCYFSGTVMSNGGNGACYLGGLIGGFGPHNLNSGSPDSYNIKVSDCCTTGKIYDANYGVGGICGLIRKGVSFECCYSTMDVEGQHGLGGILGRADDNVTAKGSASYGISISKCIAWNGKINSTKHAANVNTINVGSNYSAGVVVGRGNAYDNFSDCYRKPDFQSKFTCNGENISGVNYNTLFDQENSASGSALAFNGLNANYFQPYHGKAAGASETLSDVAVRLGWSDSVWSFEHDEPELL